MSNKTETNTNKAETNTKPSFDPTAAFTPPNFDVDALVANQRRNVEALTKANKAASEGAQAFATRQAEILKTAVDSFVTTVSGLMTAGDPKAGVAKQAQIAKLAFETSNANLRELGEIAAKAQAKSIDVINRRVIESFDEFQGIAAKT